MIRFDLHPQFKRAYKKRIARDARVKQHVEDRIDMFLSNPKHPLLKDHALSGRMKGFRAFSITGDLRIIYRLEDDVAYFLDIGTHNQVY